MYKWIHGVWFGDWIYWTLTDWTSSNYSAIANSHTLQFATARTEPSQSAVSSLAIDGCQQCLLLRCSCSYRLATVPLLTHRYNCLTPRLMAISHQTATLLTAASSLNSSTSCPSYNVLERTAQKTPSLCCCFHLLPYKMLVWLFYGHYLAMGLYATI
jgi:hypothetical protein